MVGSLRSIWNDVTASLPSEVWSWCQKIGKGWVIQQCTVESFDVTNVTGSRKIFILAKIRIIEMRLKLAKLTKSQR